MQDHYTSEDLMALVQVISKLYCYQSEEKVGQTMDQFWIDHEIFWSSTGSSATLYICTISAIKYGKWYLWHNLYTNSFTNFLVLVGCRVTSKILGVGPSEINWKYYNHVQRGQSSCLQSDSSEKQSIFYGASKMDKNSIMGTRFFYNWTDMMVDIVLDNIVKNYREPRHARIFNAWIEDWESGILRTRYQEN